MRWTDLAKRATALMPVEARHGGKQLAMAAAADQLGLTRQSLRNIVAAYRFLDSIDDEHKDVRVALSALNYTAVEIYSRWANYDRRAAYAHARQAAEQGLSVRSVIAAEKAARQMVAEPSVSLSRRLLAVRFEHSGFHPTHFRDDIERQIERCQRVAPGKSTVTWDWELTKNELSNALGIYEVITRFPPPGSLHDPFLSEVAVLEIGERAVDEGYQRQARDLLARAMAATTLYPIVICAAEKLDSLQKIAERLPAPLGVVGSALSTGGYAPLIVRTPNIGGIIFTCVEHAHRDLFGL